MQKVAHVAWLRMLLPDEPPTTLEVNTLASCFAWHAYADSIVGTNLLLKCCAWFCR